MKNTIKKRIATGLMLSAFVLTNASLPVLAVQQTAKPVLRDSGESTLQLRGTVQITNKKSPVSISLRDSDVKQVLRMFADKAGLNIVFHPNVTGNVTLDLVDVPLNDAFGLVMEISELTYTLDGNTLVVAPAGANFSMAKQEMTLIPVKYIDAGAIAQFLNQNIYGKKAGLSKDVAVTNPATNELLIFGTQNEVAIAKKVIDKFDRKPETNIFKVNHTTPAEMADMICKMLLPNTTSGGKSTGGAAGVMTGAAAEGGGGSGSMLTLNGGTVACSIGSNITAGNISSLGLQNLAVAYYSQLGTIDIIGGSPQQVEMIREFIDKTDKKQPQAHLEVSIMELNETGSKEMENIWEVNNKYFAFNFAGGTTAVQPITFFGDNIISGNSNYIRLSMKYILDNGKGRMVANPKILITNGQESVIDLTSDYVKTVKSEILQTVGGFGATQRTYEIGTDMGLKINITPFISPDGYVSLNITPDYATLKGTIEVLNPQTEVSDLVATLLQRRNLDLKNVRIKDGDTLVIGGMLEEIEKQTVKKIPFLGDIPLLGMMFRSTTNSKSKSEMVIMITPKIITDNEDATSTEAL